MGDGQQIKLLFQLKTFAEAHGNKSVVEQKQAIVDLLKKQAAQRLLNEHKQLRILDNCALRLNPATATPQQSPHVQPAATVIPQQTPIISNLKDAFKQLCASLKELHKALKRIIKPQPQLRPVTWQSMLNRNQKERFLNALKEKYNTVCTTATSKLTEERYAECLHNIGNEPNDQLRQASELCQAFIFKLLDIDGIDKAAVNKLDIKDGLVAASN